MAGNFLIDGVGRWIDRRRREKKLRLAARWPITQAQINHWEVLNADQDAATMGAPYQIEAGFHFILNGEYFGGYVRSEPMVRREAERMAQGAPRINVRYDPANPDRNFVLPEDNSGNLPFAIYTGPKA
jgi:hypothetical protein